MQPQRTGRLHRKHSTTGASAHPFYVSDFILQLTNLPNFKSVKFFLAFCIEVCYTRAVGAWLSLVERFLGVEEVVGSNPVAPTSLDISRLQGLSECLSDGSIFLCLKYPLSRF